MTRKYNTICSRKNNPDKLQEKQTQRAIKAAEESSKRISKINRAARAKGMSYGQYTALEAMRQEARQ